MEQPPAPQPPATAPQMVSPNGLAVAALVVGIIALLFSFIPIIGVITWILGPLAIIFGAVAIAKANKGAPRKGMAIAGLILGVISVLIAVLWVIGLVGSVTTGPGY